MFKNKDYSRDLDSDFAPTPAPDPRTPIGPTQIAHGAAFRGELRTAGMVVVEGAVAGTLVVDGDVQIGAKGNVEAEVEGKNITVAGTVKGRIFADGRVVLLSGSRVEGDIHAQSLKIEDAVYFQGGCVMGDGARKRRESDNLQLPESVLNLKAA